MHAPCPCRSLRSTDNSGHNNNNNSSSSNSSDDADKSTPGANFRRGETPDCGPGASERA